MAHFDFAVMYEDPKPDCRYDDYEPEKYALVKVSDDDIDKVVKNFEDIPCYWHTLSCPEKGLAYCGITLFPPSSLTLLRSVLQNAPNPEGFLELILLLETAIKLQKFVLCYGL